MHYYFKMKKLIFKLFYLNKNIAIFLLLALVFLASCALKISGEAVKKLPEDIPIEIARNPEVYFCPKEDCSKVFEEKIKNANSSVHCAFYDVELKNIISSLAAKSRVADVKAIIDESNYEGQIKGNGIRLDNDKQLMHNKFCVIDNGVVITGSFNPTENDNYHNNNNIVVVYSNVLAKNYEDEFNELWNGEFGKGGNVEYTSLYINNIKIESYFCPEDNCASHIIDMIKGAKISVYFMSFSFTNEDISDALIMKNNLDIKGIFDSSQSSSKFSQFKRLQEFGINVKKDANKYKMHHKVFIIDNETVATGSFNPTLSADTKNDENLLVIHDKKIANDFLKEFDGLWS